MNPAEVVYKIANKAKNLSDKVSFDDVIKIVDVSKNFLPAPKKISSGPTIFGTGLTLTNNEIKDIMKVITFLENRGILLGGTTRKITSQEGRFFKLPRPLMIAGLPLIKNVLTPFAKSILIPLGLSAGISAADATIQKKSMDHELQH